MAWTPRYGTTREIAILAGYDYGDTALMAEIAVAQEFVEDAVEQFCSTVFYDEPAKARTYDGTGTTMLTLGYYLRTLTSVEFLDGNGVVYDTVTDVVPGPQSPRTGLYRWLDRRRVLDVMGFGLVENPFPVGVNNVRVTGDWGFEDIPSPIKVAVAYGVRHFFNLRNFDATKRMETGINRTVEQVAGSSIHYLPPMSLKILAGWVNSRRWSE